jgi:hypothetical protein
MMFIEKAEFLLKQLEARHLLKESVPTAVTHIKMAKVDITYPLGSFVYRDYIANINEVTRKGKIQKEYTRDEVLSLIAEGLKKILE